MTTSIKAKLCNGSTNEHYNLQSVSFNWTYGLSGTDFRVATLSKSYLTATGITMQSVKSIGQFQLV